MGHHRPPKRPRKPKAPPKAVAAKRVLFADSIEKAGSKVCRLDYSLDKLLDLIPSGIPSRDVRILVEYNNKRAGSHLDLVMYIEEDLKNPNYAEEINEHYENTSKYKRDLKAWKIEINHFKKILKT